MKYIAHYPEALQQQVQQLLDQQQLGAMLRKRYAGKVHTCQSDKALFDYVQALKAEHMRQGEPIAKVAYDNRLQVIAHALGTHTTISRVQGSKLKAKREIRVSSLFKTMPEPFLNMIVVHELAHLREKQHDKAFYKLCTYMNPDYFQLEFDLRLALTHIDLVGPLAWT
jgi:predicted metal-dependent hydrolase